MRGDVKTLVAELLSRFFWVTALVMMALGLWLPGDFDFLRPFIPLFLGGILFFTALKVPLGQIVEHLHVRRLPALAVLTVIKLVVLGAVGWGIAQVIAPQWALGVALVMAMPAGLSASAMTDLYRGQVGFALVFTLVTSVFAPLSIPALLLVLDPDTSIALGVLGERALYITLLLGTPLTLAQIVRRLAPALVRRHHHRWSYGAVCSSCLLIFVSISSNRLAWQDLPLTALLTPLLVCTAALSVALATAIALARYWRGPEGVAFGFCCLWMNNGLAVAFADRFYHGNAGVILPAVLMQLPIIASVAVLGAWWTAQAARVRVVTESGSHTASGSPEVRKSGSP